MRIDLHVAADGLPLPACPRCGAGRGAPCTHAAYDRTLARAHAERVVLLRELAELVLAVVALALDGDRVLVDLLPGLRLDRVEDRRLLRRAIRDRVRA